MKKLSVVFALLLCFLALLSLGGCATKVMDFSAFNTAVHIETRDSGISKSTQNQIKNLIVGLEEEFSITKPNSTVSKLNNAQAGVTVECSQRFIQIFDEIYGLSTFTKGNFNPAVYPLVDLWKFTNYPVLNFAPPSSRQIQALLPLINLDCFILNRQNYTITKTNDNAKIDLGGYLKGYATEEVAKLLRLDGHTQGYVSIGSSSITLLSMDTVTIRHPENRALGIIDIDTSLLDNISLSTSGTYERVYEYGEQKYSHIINPINGYPTQTGVTSATAINVNGATADALTTALCLFEHDTQDSQNSKLVDFMHKILLEYPTAKLFVVYCNGENKILLTNAKKGEDFTLLDDNYSVVNI